MKRGGDEEVPEPACCPAIRFSLKTRHIFHEMGLKEAGNDEKNRGEKSITGTLI